MVITVAALRFLYTVTLQKTWSVEAVIPTPKTPQTSASPKRAAHATGDNVRSPGVSAGQ